MPRSPMAMLQQATLAGQAHPSALALATSSATTF
jgi:hypothetical protein